MEGDVFVKWAEKLPAPTFKARYGEGEMSSVLEASLVNHHGMADD